MPHSRASAQSGLVGLVELAEATIQLEPLESMAQMALGEKIWPIEPIDSVEWNRQMSRIEQLGSKVQSQSRLR